MAANLKETTYHPTLKVSGLHSYVTVAHIAGTTFDAIHIIVIVDANIVVVVIVIVDIVTTGVFRILQPKTSWRDHLAITTRLYHIFKYGMLVLQCVV